MTKTIFVTRKIPEIGISMLRDKGYTVDVREKDLIPSQKELIKALKGTSYDAVVTLLTDKVDNQLFDAVPTAKIFANYATGFDNINLEEAKQKGITITNAPAISTSEAVAEHTFALMLHSLLELLKQMSLFVKENILVGIQ